MANNSQARKWALVINNPLEAGLDHTAIAAILALFSPAYYCMADEITATGTFHAHVFLYSPSPIRSTTLKNRFPTAHIEKAYSRTKENRDYITKSGKWAGTDKAETTVADSFLEWGALPAEKEEANPDLYRLMRELREGKRTAEIIEQAPKYAFRVRDIDTLRQTLLADRLVTENRKLEVAYLYGDTGAGKTRSIYEAHDPKEICRVTNYHKGVPLTRTTGRTFWCSRSFILKYPLGICSIILIYTRYPCPPGTQTAQPVIPRYISLQTCRLKRSAGMNSITGGRYGRRFLDVFTGLSSFTRTERR